MKPSVATSKLHQVTSWVEMFRKSSSRVMVSGYSYECFFSGKLKNKTLIVFPDELEKKGIIAIDKPLDEVQMQDISKLQKKLNLTDIKKSPV